MKGRLLDLEGISNQARQYIDHEIERAAMASVLDLQNILELIGNRFDDGTLSEEDPIKVRVNTSPMLRRT